MCGLCGVVQEIDDLLSGVLTSEDEDAVEREFDEMMSREAATAEASGDNDISLPDVPSEELPGQCHNRTIHVSSCCRNSFNRERRHPSPCVHCHFQCWEVYNVLYVV